MPRFRVVLEIDWTEADGSLRDAMQSHMEKAAWFIPNVDKIADIEEVDEVERFRAHSGAT